VQPRGGRRRVRRDEERLRRHPGPDTINGTPGGPGNDTLYALVDDNEIDIVDCGAGHDVAWLNVKEKGKYVIRGCEARNWIVPTPEQAAAESGG